MCVPLPQGHRCPQSISLLGWASHQSHLRHHSDSPQGPGSLVKHGTCHVFFLRTSRLRLWVTLLSSLVCVCLSSFLCPLFFLHSLYNKGHILPLANNMFNPMWSTTVCEKAGQQLYSKTKWNCFHLNWMRRHPLTKISFLFLVTEDLNDVVALLKLSVEHMLFFFYCWSWILKMNMR